MATKHSPLALLALALLAPRATAQPSCPLGAPAYSYTAAAASSCCPAPGATTVSAALGCAPDASLGGPANTAFFYTGFQAEGVAGFGVTGSAPAFVADRFGMAGQALSLAGGTQLDATAAAIKAALPSGAGPMSAAAWVKCPGTQTATTAAVSWGSPSAFVAGNPTTSFGIYATGGSGGAFGLLSSTVRTATGTAAVSLANDGVGSSATFNGAYGVAADAANGLLYVLDTANNRVRKIVVATATVTTFAGSGTASTSTSTGDGVGTNAQFSGMRAGIVGPNSELYVADTTVHRVRVVWPNATVATISGTGVAGVLDGVGTAASHTGPCAFAFDSNWVLYVSDYNGGRLRAININSFQVTTVAGYTTGGTTSSQTVASIDGQGTSATFTQMTGIAYWNNAIYGTEYLLGKIRKIDLSAGCRYCVSTISGTAQNISASGQSLDGTLATAMYAQPWAIAADSAGILYVAQYNVDNVRKIDIAGNLVTTIAGQNNCSGGSALALCGAGTSGVGHVDAAVGTNARLNYLRGITFYPPSTLYLPEQTGNYIRSIGISAGYPVGTLAGRGLTAATTNAGEVDGAPNVASLTAPRQGALDANGGLVFVDSTNGVLRRMNIATGSVTTLAGKGVAGYADGLGTSAGYTLLSGIAIDRPVLARRSKDLTRTRLTSHPHPHPHPPPPPPPSPTTHTHTHTHTPHTHHHHPRTLSHIQLRQHLHERVDEQLAHPPRAAAREWHLPRHNACRKGYGREP